MPTSGNAFSRSFLDLVMPMPETEWRTSADVYLMNLAALAGCVGAIDEPLGFYRKHDKNLSSHVRESRIVIDKIYNAILRERNTDDIIHEFCKRNGSNYNNGALTKSYPHLQLVMVYDKLANAYKKSRFRSPFHDYYDMTIALYKLENVSSLKMACIHIWLFMLLMVPSKLAERMAVFGYERGAMLYAQRTKSLAKRKIRNNGKTTIYLDGTQLAERESPRRSSMTSPRRQSVDAQRI